MGGTVALFAAFALAVAGCVGSQTPAALELSGVNPSTARNDSAAPVVISGGPFHVWVTQQLSAEQSVVIDQHYRAFLGEVELNGVVRRSAGELSAEVPAGLAPGVYALRVEGPGVDATLEEAFVVTEPDLPPEPVPAEASLLATDVLGDGTADAQLAGYLGRLHIGPNRTGSGYARSTSAGGFETISVSYQAGNGRNSVRNASGAPYPSLGFSGCAADSPECGPDDEDGRPAWLSGRFSGVEYLSFTGVRSQGDWRIGYWAVPSLADATATANAYGINAAPSGPPGTSTRTSMSAGLFFGTSTVYLAGADSTRTAGPWLYRVDTRSDVELSARDMPRIGDDGLAGTAMIDAISAFNGLLYLANAGGCLRATVATPRAYSGATATDWADCTPSAPEYTAHQPLSTTRLGGFQPADRSVPKLVSFGGRLYLARNTVAGPQLWRCAPATVSGPAPASATQCDPGDWSLIAPNTQGDATLSQFDDPAHLRVTLLAATANRLYLGFDAANGVRVFRSAVADPVSRGDFEGSAACRMDSPTCLPFGGRAFGDPRQTRFFDGQALTVGGTESVYVTVGDGSVPVRVYRLID